MPTFVTLIVPFLLNPRAGEARRYSGFLLNFSTTKRASSPRGSSDHATMTEPQAPFQNSDSFPSVNGCTHPGT